MGYYTTLSREKYLELKYDFFHSNERIENKKQIKTRLASFPLVKIKDVDPSYLHWSKSSHGKYKKILEHSEFRVIKQSDFFKNLVGDFRVKDFVCKDSMYRKCLFNSQEEFYWLIDEKLPLAILEIQKSLRQKGYNPDGFKITYGHRHPKKNEEKHGASLSKHIKGQAIDMVIYDINKDGRYTKEDKEIVLDIAENEVIKNMGGIGRYPGSRTVHIDVRGTRARWDSY